MNHIPNNVQKIDALCQDAKYLFSKIDPDLKLALSAGLSVGYGMRWVPVIGRYLSVPVGIAIATNTFLTAKIKAK